MFARMAADGKLEHFAAFTFRLASGCRNLYHVQSCGLAGRSWLCHQAGLEHRYWGCMARDRWMLKPPMAYSFYAGLKESDLADIIDYCGWFRRYNDAISHQYQPEPERCIL
jgi:hypothetical protein